MESACWRGISVLEIGMPGESYRLQSQRVRNRQAWRMISLVGIGLCGAWRMILPEGPACLETDIAGGTAANSIIPILSMLHNSLAKRSRCFKTPHSLDSSAHTGLQYQSTIPTSETLALRTEYSEAEGARDGRISAGIRIEKGRINASRGGL